VQWLLLLLPFYLVAGLIRTHKPLYLRFMTSSPHSPKKGFRWGELSAGNALLLEFYQRKATTISSVGR